MNTKNLKWLGAILLALVSSSVLATQSTSYYIYDESGHVIGEYDANGNPVQEHVYLGDRPVAVVTGGSSSGGTVDYVTTDQLNTPRVITDSSQTVLWSWNSDPFGNGNPTGSLTYDLRFPGQQYDSETGHSYNYFRDYDSGTDRFIESDPSGINGGYNTYAYVGGNPFAFMDVRGLGPCPPGSLPNCDAMYTNNPDQDSGCVTPECAAGIPPNNPPAPWLALPQGGRCFISCQVKYQKVCTAISIAVAYFTEGIGYGPTNIGCIFVKSYACGYKCINCGDK